MTKRDRKIWTELCAKHRLFVDELCVDLNIRRAGAAAGLSYGRARNLMVEPRIKAAIVETQALSAERASVRAQDVLRDLRIVADKCMGRIPVMRVVKVKRPRGQGKRLRVIEVEELREEFIWDAAGANAALYHLGRHLKLFTEVVDAPRHEKALEELLKDADRLKSRVTRPSGLPVVEHRPGQARHSFGRTARRKISAVLPRRERRA